MHHRDSARPRVRPAYLCRPGLSRPFDRRQLALRSGVGWGVGALRGRGVSADAQAYFGTRPGLVPSRRHDV
jgi:hypothetical protein